MSTGDFSKHAFSNLVSSLIPLVIALLTIPLYLSYIGDERFGALAIIMSFLLYFGFMDMGLGRATSKRIAQLSQASSQSRSDVLWTAIFASFLLGVVAGLLLWIGAAYYLSTKVAMSDGVRLETLLAVKYVAFAFPLLLPTASLTGALHAKYHYKQANIILITNNTLSQVIPLIAASIGLIDISELILITLAIKVFSLFFLIYYCYSIVPLRNKPCFSKKEFLDMIGYGGWVSLIGIIAPVLATLDRLIIASVIGVKSVTYYVVPFDLVFRAMVIPGSISSALFPRLASLGNKQALQLSVDSTRLLISVMTPLIIIAIALVGKFLELWLGEEFAFRALHIPEIILVGIWLNSFVVPTYTRHLAKHNPRTIVFIYLLEIPIYLLALTVGLDQFGILGAAFAWTFRVLIDTVIILKINSVLGNIVRVNIHSILLFLSFISMYFSGMSFTILLLFSGVIASGSLWLDRHVLFKTYQEIRGRVL